MALSIAGRINILIHRLRWNLETPPLKKAGFDYGTCQTQLRFPWHAANPLDRAGALGTVPMSMFFYHVVRA